MLALVLLLIAFLHTAFAASAPGRTIISRQTTTSLSPPSACTSACGPLESALDGTNTTLAALCTSALVNDYVKCFNCIIAAGDITQAAAQGQLDGYVSECSDAGYPVAGATVSADSSSSNSGSSTSGNGFKTNDAARLTLRDSAVSLCLSISLILANILAL
ncbi:hypothetical protein DFH07DRAFT_832905 [Mycena maculata]|uniref:Uncharacterized protein n=1 Tax=Mycena maculata TaxID=230809 RepID=A0AAD7ILW2_9AGAR|nr:hypothetical protein DFH07DRAFT_832905 [Mycena maculata]